jgi:hypothetical protein
MTQTARRVRKLANVVVRRIAFGEVVEVCELEAVGLRLPW